MCARARSVCESESVGERGYVRERVQENRCRGKNENGNVWIGGLNFNLPNLLLLGEN